MNFIRCLFMYLIRVMLVSTRKKSHLNFKYKIYMLNKILNFFTSEYLSYINKMITNSGSFHLNVTQKKSLGFLRANNICLSTTNSWPNVIVFFWAFKICNCKCEKISAITHHGKLSFFVLICKKTANRNQQIPMIRQRNSHLVLLQF